MEELAGAAAWSGRLRIAPERWDCRRNRLSTDKRKEVSTVRAYYAKVFRHLLSTTVLTGFVGGAN
jgi:hypothetical protein